MLPLYRDEACLVARHDHPILQERRIAFKRLAREQWVLQRRDASLRQALGQITILNFRLGVKPMQVNLLVCSVARHNAMLQLFRGALADAIGG